MKVDYISDLHLDFYIRHDGNYEKWENKTHLFLEKLLPDTKGEVLVIAGDISHYNIQSKWCLEYFSKQYEHVFFVMGNHDYYLISGGQSKKYKNNSINREFELMELISSLNNVTHLYDFEEFSYNNIKIAGSTLWYPLQEQKDIDFFNNISNDSKLIKKLDVVAEHSYETFKYEHMEEVDILVTHVPPDILQSHIKFDSTSCYLNELKNIKAKHVVTGHVHEQNKYYNTDGTNIYINALGYPNEWLNNMNPFEYSKEERQQFASKWNTIKSFEVK